MTGSARSAAPQKSCSNRFSNGMGVGSIVASAQRAPYELALAGLMMSTSLWSPTTFIRHTSPQAPHSFTGDSAALKPEEWMSTSTDFLSPQPGHFMEISFLPVTDEGRLLAGTRNRNLDVLDIVFPSQVVFLPIAYLKAAAPPTAIPW